MPKIPLEDLKKDTTIQTNLLGEKLTFKTTWGLFCPEEIDVGTKLLLNAIGEGKCGETLTILADSGAQNVSVLDIGCGYGPIGIALAKAFPSTFVDLIDKDFVAIEYSEKNAKENLASLDKLENLAGLDNIEKIDPKFNERVHAFLSNGFSHVPAGKTYNLILSNLPAKVSKEFFWILFGEAFDHIETDGYFIVVVIKQLEIMVRKNFNTLFGNSDVVVRDKTYSVILAKKE